MCSVDNKQCIGNLGGDNGEYYSDSTVSSSEGTFVPPALSSYAIALLNSNKLTRNNDLDIKNIKSENKFEPELYDEDVSSFGSGGGNEIGDTNLRMRKMSLSSSGATAAFTNNNTNTNTNNTTITTAAAAAAAAAAASNGTNNEKFLNGHITPGVTKSANARSSTIRIRRFGRGLGPPKRTSHPDNLHSNDIDLQNGAEESNINLSLDDERNSSSNDSKGSPIKPSKKTHIRFLKNDEIFHSSNGNLLLSDKNYEKDLPSPQSENSDLLIPSNNNHINNNNKTNIETDNLNLLYKSKNTSPKQLLFTDSSKSSISKNISNGLTNARSHHRSDKSLFSSSTRSKNHDEIRRHPLINKENELGVLSKHHIDSSQLKYPNASPLSAVDTNRMKLNLINKEQEKINDQYNNSEIKYNIKHNDNDNKLFKQQLKMIHDTNIDTQQLKKNKSIITVNKKAYQKIEVLGKGGSSKVYKVQTPNNKFCALKKVSLKGADESVVAGFKGEIKLLLKLRNEPRVIKLKDYEISDSNLFIVMECGEVDLARLLSGKLDHPLDLNFVRFYAAEMFKCVLAVHECGIVHSDLKPANFLMVKGMLKIIDFGIANAVPDYTVNIRRDAQIGTPNYMAPESLIDTNQCDPELAQTGSKCMKIGRPSDVWSCGCILYQMIYGRPPYAHYTGTQRMLAIMNPKVQVPFPREGICNSKVPISAVDTIRKCLKYNPDDRPTILQILNGKFFNPDEDFI